MFFRRAIKKLKKKRFKTDNFYSRYKDLLQKSPLDKDLHFNFAIGCISKENYLLAVAELKTSLVLGMSAETVQEEMAKIPSIPLITMDYNTYFRFESLRKEISTCIEGSESFSVLDVGGGEGGLAHFLPTNKYCLVEPDVNGISGTNLPFEDKSFDIVVSCHVLEHIPVEERTIFLNQLCSKARKAVVLLNPFQVTGHDEVKRLNLHVDVTGAWWAKEHLECSLPSTEFIEEYSKIHGLQCEVIPNGSMALSFASVYVDYFAKQARSFEDLEKVNRFMNENFTDLNFEDTAPNAYVVKIFLGECCK